MMLAFKPNLFFNELEKISRIKRKTLENAMREAQRQKLIEKEAEKDANVVRLTDLGKKMVRPFVAQRLPENARLLVIFDIPEDMAVVRARFRRILQSWHFSQVQKSVWITSYDHRQSVKEVVSELDIENCVELYECVAI